MPAFVVGYEIPDGTLDYLHGLAGLPDWLMAFAQQAGGYGMSYPTVVGACLRWQDNFHCFDGSADWLIRGFQAMAEDPDETLLQSEYPTLARLVYTRGDAYTLAEVQSLEQFLRHHMSLPPIEGGIEAFIRFVPSDLLSAFGRWQVLAAVPGPDFDSIYSGLPGLYADDTNVGCLDFSTDGQFDRAKLDVLASFGVCIGQQYPRAFLLWENSD